MVFLNNIPQPGDFLNISSQPQLLANNAQLDASFGIDHYPFSNLTASNGFHNQVTTPGFISSPPVVPVVAPTTTINPIFYGFQPLDVSGTPTTSLGLLQYSRGPSNAVPSPVTFKQSISTPITLLPTNSTTVLDFTGIPRAFCMLYVSDMATLTKLTDSITYVIWNGTNFEILNITGGIIVTVTNDVNILQITNLSMTITFSNVYWTLQMLRLQ